MPLDNSDESIITQKKAKWGGYSTSLSSNGSLESVQLINSSDSNINEENKSQIKKNRANIIPLKYQKEQKENKKKVNIRKGPFTYKKFKEDSKKVYNPRIELEKRKIVEKNKLIEGIYWSFNVQNGLSQLEYLNINQKGTYI